MPLQTYLVALAALTVATSAPGQVVDSTLTSWVQNTTGQHGTSTDPTINSLVSQILANVQEVRYTATNVYVNATGVPSYSVGPFPGDPAYPSNRNWLFDLPRSPQVQSGTKTATGLGPIGTFVNGVSVFNPKDANSYNNQNVWHQNAVVVEASSFDSALGHPAPVMGATGNPVPGIYHHHQRPPSLLAQLTDSGGASPSPLIGFAFDGFPIYGSYGYANTNGTGGTARMRSSYQLRNITTRTTLPDGTALSPAQYGPAVSTQFPLGYYVEDYQYVAGLGDLDQYNGRFTVTPDYPAGTYAYFATIDAAGNSAYPYMVGPSYNGVVSTDNLTQTVTVPGTAVVFTPVPEPGTLLLTAAGAVGVLFRRRRGVIR
jgi:hypothetical protein